MDRSHSSNKRISIKFFQELSTYKDMKYEFEDKKNKLEKQIQNLEFEKEYLVSLKSILESKKFEVDKLEYNQNTLKKNKTIDEDFYNDLIKKTKSFVIDKDKILSINESYHFFIFT